MEILETVVAVGLAVIGILIYRCLSELTSILGRIEGLLHYQAHPDLHDEVREAIKGD